LIRFLLGLRAMMLIGSAGAMIGAGDSKGGGEGNAAH
jgi:hypothetical protein